MLTEPPEQPPEKCLGGDFGLDLKLPRQKVGRDARNLGPLLGNVPRIESAHPSPMVANGDFFGSRPFSRANELLESLGAGPVDWKLP